jgi:hypothetical protein
MRWHVAVLGAVALACGDGVGPGTGSGPVHIGPAASAYKPGTTVNLTVTNLSGEKFRYSTCSYHIEREGQNGDWQLVYRDQRPCPAVLVFLDPQASRHDSVRLPDDLASGLHRVRFPEIGVRGKGETFIAAVQIGGSFDIEP